MLARRAASEGVYGSGALPSAATACAEEQKRSGNDASSLPAVGSFTRRTMPPMFAAFGAKFVEISIHKMRGVCEILCVAYSKTGEANVVKWGRDMVRRGSVAGGLCCGGKSVRVMSWPNHRSATAFSAKSAKVRSSR